MKRFTDTAKWVKPWFQDLPPHLKCFWNFICDNADAAGVWEPNFKLASFQIGKTVSESELIHFGDRVGNTLDGKLALVSFIEFQYGKLSHDCKAHIPVFRALERHGLIDPSGNLAIPRRKFGLTKNVRQRIIDRDKSICIYTGSRLADEQIWIEHLVPRSKGGGNSDENLFVASKVLNSKRNDMDLDAFCTQEGFDLSTIQKRIIHRLSIPYSKAMHSHKEEEEEKEKEKEGPKGLFDEFWQAYPRRVGRADAERAFAKHGCAALMPKILVSIRTCKISADWTKEGGQFIPHPATWLNRRGWEDELQPRNGSGIQEHIVPNIIEV